MVEEGKLMPMSDNSKFCVKGMINGLVAGERFGVKGVFSFF